MADNAQKPGPHAARTAAARAQRLAEQLRENLKRRKASVRQQTGAGVDAGDCSKTASDGTDAAD
jgi:hypothetical protein